MRQRFVESAVVEVARPRCRDERDGAVVSQLIQRSVVADVRGFEVQSWNERRSQQNRCHENKQPGFCAERALPHPGKQLARGEYPPKAQHQADQHDHPDVVGLPYIDKNFLRINQVINCDRVETRFEFFEEKVLHEQYKNLSEQKPEASAQQQNAMPAGWKPTLRHNQQPEEQGNRFHQRGKKIPMEAAQKSA